MLIVKNLILNQMIGVYVKMKKKILFVINSLGVGGAEKSLISLLSTFDYSQYEVDLLMFRSTGMFLKLLPAEVNVLPQPEFLKRSSFKEQLNTPRYVITHIRTTIGLRKNAKHRVLHDAQCYWKYAGKAFDNLTKKYDVAIAWGQGNPTHYVAEKVCANKKIAFINVNYEMAGHNKAYDYPYYLKYQYIVAVSDELTKLVAEIFPEMKEKIRTIYDINNARLIYKMANFSNPFKNIDSKVIMVTAGRLVPQKGYDMAVEAARRLKENGFDFKWFFVGDGGERKKIESMISEYGLEKNVILVGATDNPYVYMKNADIYVQTSRFEGYCLTLGEARILNKPVISTNFDVVYNQLVDGENGLIVDMDPKAIARAIEQLSKDFVLQEHIIANLQKEKKGNIEEIEKLYALLNC